MIAVPVASLTKKSHCDEEKLVNLAVIHESCIAIQYPLEKINTVLKSLSSEQPLGILPVINHRSSRGRPTGKKYEPARNSISHVLKLLVLHT